MCDACGMCVCVVCIVLCCEVYACKNLHCSDCTVGILEKAFCSLLAVAYRIAKFRCRRALASNLPHMKRSCLSWNLMKRVICGYAVLGTIVSLLFVWFSGQLRSFEVIA